MQGTKIFYVYLWLREDGTPYYVGKGKGRRGFINKGHTVARPKLDHYIIIQPYDSESEAFLAERFFISLFGRKDLGTGGLRNRTNGGEGPSGMCHSEKTKKLWSRLRRERPSSGFRGRQHDEYFSQTIAASNRKRVWSEESLRKLRSVPRLRIGGRFVKAG